MKILAITYCFVPLQYPATFRLLKWFSRLAERGHEVTVLCVRPDTFRGSKDTTLGDLVPPEVEAVVAPSRENTWLYRALRSRGDLFYRWFEPSKMEWFGPARRRLGSMNLREFDVLLTCSQPAVCHLLGLEVVRKFEVPWVAFLSDPWMDNPFRAKRKQAIEEFNRRMERTVLTTAGTVVVTNEEFRARLVERYGPTVGERVTVLPHCFKPDWYDRSKSESVRSAPGRKVLLMGSFYGPRSIIPLLEIIGRLLARNRLSGRLSLEVFGTMSPLEEKHRAWRAVEGVVTYRGRIDYLKSLALMKVADALLLVDAPLQDKTESVFFPSKLADYLGSGSPIVGITPENGAASRVLKETGQVVCDTADADGITRALLQVAEGRLDWGPHDVDVYKYHYRPVGDALEHILEGVRR